MSYPHLHFINLPYSSFEYAELFEKIVNIPDPRKRKIQFEEAAEALCSRGIEYYREADRVEDRDLTDEEYQKWLAETSTKVSDQIIAEWQALLRDQENRETQEEGEEHEYEDEPSESEEEEMAEVTGSQLTATQTYNGETDIEIYIQHIERNIIQFQWTAERATAIVKNKLIGAAASWLRSEELMGTQMTTWDQLKALLRSRFKSEYNELAAVRMVRNLKQKSGETCNEFFDRVVQAVDGKNHTYTIQQKSEAGYKAHFLNDVYTFFSAGMLEEIRIKAMSGSDPPRTAVALKTVAANVEIQLQKEKANKMVELEEMEAKVKKLEAELAEVKITEESGNEASCEAVQTIRGGKNQGGRNAFRRGGKANVTCYTCRNRGHYSYECRRGSYRGGRNRGTFRGGRGFNSNRGTSFYRGWNRGFGNYTPRTMGMMPQEDGWYTDELGNTHLNF